MKWTVLAAVLLAAPPCAAATNQEVIEMLAREAARNAPDLSTCNGLQFVCDFKPEDLALGGMCFGYVTAATASAMEPGKAPICIASGVTNGQIMKVVSKWLHDHPESLHLYPLECVARAVREAFPCPAK